MNNNQLGGKVGQTQVYFSLTNFGLTTWQDFIYFTLHDCEPVSHNSVTAQK